MNGALANMRVLVVEDSTDARDLLERSLHDAGFRVVSAGRAATALEYAADQEFDVIVLDVMLPDGDGFEICRSLRESGIRTPILFLTARSDVEDRVRGLDAGGDDYLRKPFALTELHARLRALGRRQGLVPPMLLKSARMVMNVGARRLSRDGKDIPLTAREWSVLVALASRIEHVVTREDLLDLAWGGRGELASDSLDVIMSRLRRKLGSGDGFTVHTLRGAGYRLDRDSE